MKPAFSAYLDVIRFLAALVVFLGHASGVNWTGGFLWQLGPYGDTCVIVFFVLSGFVIAYVTDHKEDDWRTYGTNRIARIWSVVIPAMLLTFLIDYMGVRVAPQLYIGQPWFNGNDLGSRYLLSFFMLHEVWHIDYAPGINQPFWSLGYEAFYYLVFGVLVFYRGAAKILVLTAILALGGPVIALLFPTWMLGVAAYYKCKNLTISRSLAALIFTVTSAILLISPYWIRNHISYTLMGQEIAGRYFDATIFFLNLIAAYKLFNVETGRLAYGSAIKKVASTTFVLYLFHRPLLQFFSYVGPEDASSWERRMLVIGGTTLVVVLAVPLCERLQRYLRVECMRMFNTGLSGSLKERGTS